MEEKIQRMREIVQKYDALAIEVNETFGIITEINNPIIKEVKKGKRKYTKRSEYIKMDNKNPDKYTQKKVRFCKNCGKPGHRRDGCPEAEGDRTESPAKQISGEALTLSQYEDVKTSREHGLTSKNVADEMGISIREVNLVFQSFSYDNYLKLKG